jgi:hypothetical protein
MICGGAVSELTVSGTPADGITGTVSQTLPFLSQAIVAVSHPAGLSVQTLPFLSQSLAGVCLTPAQTNISISGTFNTAISIKGKTA